MREQLEEVDTVANSPEKPTFDNTVVALERTGRLLDRAERTFSNLNACNTNPTMQKIEKVYGSVFENILGEKISTKPVEVVTPFPWAYRGKGG